MYSVVRRCTRHSTTRQDTTQEADLDLGAVEELLFGWLGGQTDRRVDDNEHIVVLSFSHRLPFSFLNQLGLSIDISLPIIIDLVSYFLVFISLSDVST